MKTDTLSRDDMKPAPKTSKPTKLVKRWVVMVAGRTSRKLYTSKAVRKLVSRANRAGLDCYASPMMVRL